LAPEQPKPSKPATLSQLIQLYKTAPNSPFHKLKHNSRAHYDTLLKLIERDYGQSPLAEIGVGTLDQWYEAWREGGKVAVSRAKMVMLRNLFNFGTMATEDENCARLFGLINIKPTELPKARTEHLTRDQANLIRAKAHENKRPSIALAQAFQSDADLSQKDVIGEWVPMSEPGGLSDIMFVDEEGRQEKWLRGIRWNEIDENLTLRHASLDKQIVVELRKAPMVLAEFKTQFGFDPEKQSRAALPSSGAIIRSEWSDLPWSAVEFRRWWRKIADACDIPKNVRNSDSRVKARNETPEGATIAENKSENVFE
jgi:hypothetical protein